MQIVVVFLFAFMFVGVHNYELMKQFIRVSCIGDSITDDGVYVPMLQRRLGSDYLVQNFGKSGCTMQKKGLTTDGSKPESYWTTDEWQQAQESDPAIVTIMLGTNDSKQVNWPEGDDRASQYVQDYKDMINIMQSLPSKPKIYLCKPPPLFEPYPYTMQKEVVNQELGELIDQIASEMNLEVIDVWSAFDSDASLSSDGCHPNRAGDKVIADTIDEALTKEMTKEMIQ